MSRNFLPAEIIAASALRNVRITWSVEPNRMEAKNVDLSALRIDRTEEPQGPPRTFKPIPVLASLVIVGIAACGVYWGYQKLVSPALEVKLATVAWTSPSQTNGTLTASGYVVAQRKASIASKGSGRLVFLGVVEGDRVRTGEIIARLEDSDIVAQLDQARANLKLNEADLADARRSLERQKALLEKGLATEAEFDAAEARLRRVEAAIDVAKAAVAGAEVALENTNIRAPFSGTVLAKNADVGEMVVPMAASAGSRSAVVTIADMSSLQVEADVSESNIERITPGQPCEITLDAYTDKRYEAYVAKIVPTADRAKATVMVKIGFKNYDNRVLPEMGAKVLFLSKPSEPSLLNAKPILTIPTTAVVERDGKKVVFIVRESAAVEVAVKTGRTLGSNTEIVEGLTSGQKVIDKVVPEVEQGVKVKVL